jgi:MYXO-CTERM domain-containing protein
VPTFTTGSFTVTDVTPTPQPTTAGLLASALVALGVVRRRRG